MKLKKKTLKIHNNELNYNEQKKQQHSEQDEMENKGIDWW